MRRMTTAFGEGQRRPVTALFADVVGSTSIAESMDPEEYAALIGGVIARMSEAVARYEGTVANVLGDGILAFFGATQAHEDDPQRAVRAGLEMVADVLAAAPGDRLRIRVGVNTGPVVVQAIGADPTRRDATALGDAVNVAARLQAEATPGTVMVSDDTYRFVAGSVDARHVGPLELKGKAVQVDAWEITAWTATAARPRGVPGLSSPMVGRDPELERLAELLRAVRAGRGRAAVVLGEPGIGKSRLLRELRELAAGEPDGVAWFEGRCVSYGQQMPHHLVLGILRSVLGLPEPEIGTTTGERLLARLAELAPGAPRSVAEALAHLLSVDLPSGTTLDHLEPAIRQERYVEACRELIRAAAARGPIVLACEDTHWADPASVELLTRLLPIVHELPVLMTIVARQDREAPGWRLVTTARDALGDSLLELRLVPLSHDDSRHLVANLLEIESLPGPTREAILARADGNPFFVEEIIRMLIDRGTIVRSDGRWIATPGIETVEIPASIHGLLLARIDRLPPEARETLRVAAVIGRRFPVRVLREVVANR